MKQYVTEIKIKLTEARNGLVGFCEFVYNNEWKFSSIAIYTRGDGFGIRLLYPNSGKKNPHFYPITKVLGALIEYAIHEAYLDAINNRD